MCGICGFYGDGGSDPLSTVIKMREALSHRGPDDAGTWVSERHPLALGHRRLSILDLSPEGHQPMRAACGSKILVFNGEIYNQGDLRRALVEQGKVFRGHSDTEVLLAAVTHWGVRATLRKLVGMFALAFWDDVTATLTLAVDRLGEKPLYYGWLDGVLVFASELKSLRAHPCWQGAIDQEAVASYLSHGYIAAPRSIYRGIAKLLPGTLLELPVARSEAADVAPEHYWRPGCDGERSGWEEASTGEVVDELERRLMAAVSLQMVADVPLGAFLSGGIDSSLVVALMQARSNRPIRTFAIGFDEPGYDESPHARAVAVHLGTEHFEAVMTHRDVQAVVPRLPDIYDEPFADPSAVPVCFLTAFARRHVTVSLSGDAGDELFLGYENYRHVRKLWRLFRPAPLSLRRGTAAIMKQLPVWMSPRQQHRRLALFARILPATSPQHMHRLLTSGDPAALLSPNLRAAALRPAAAESTGSDRGDWLSDLGLIDLKSYLPGDILVKVDRAAMAVGLETRVPMLDHRVVEFALALPTRFKMRNGRGKWILRELLDRYVPRRLVDRPKMGFGAPVGLWLRGPLRDWAEDLLCPKELADGELLDPVRVGKIWRDHLGGGTKSQSVLWSILMLQGWLRSVRTGKQ